MSSISDGLGAGQRDIRFTSILSGVRGSGKTVLLSTIQNQARNSGWLVLPISGTKNLISKTRSALYQLPTQYEWLDLSNLIGSRAITKKRSFKLWGFRSEKTSTESKNLGQDVDMEHLLRYVVKSAAERGVVVLLTVDELHSIDRDEARTLFNDVQQITKVEGLPLAFLGAGLSDMDYTLFKDRALTFFRRCHRYKMPPLGLQETINGLRTTIEDHGGTVEEPALRLMSDKVNGLPYTLQAVGHAAWEISDAPNNPIDVDTAQQAAIVAEEMVTENISLPSFYDLNHTERDYLVGLAKLGDKVPVTDITQKIVMPSHKMQEADRRLRVSGYLTKSEDGTRVLSNLVPREVILRETDILPFPSQLASESAGDALSADASPCGRWMPRAKTVCVLAAGHKGSCRSKK